MYLLFITTSTSLTVFLNIHYTYLVVFFLNILFFPLYHYTIHRGVKLSWDNLLFHTRKNYLSSIPITLLSDFC